MNFESILRLVIDYHAKAILAALQQQLQRGVTNTIFSAPGVVDLIGDGTVWMASYEITTDISAALRVRLCADEIILVTIDARTGRLNMRDTGDLAAVGRSQRFTSFNEKINENPTTLSEALIRLRSSVSVTILSIIWMINLWSRLLQTWLSKKPSIWVSKVSEDAISLQRVGDPIFPASEVLI